MKKIQKIAVTNRILAIMLSMSVMSACNIFPDDRNNFLPDEMIYINISENRVNVPVGDGGYTFAVIKSGKGLSEADVFLSFDADVLEEYNTIHGTSYKMVPENILQGFSQENFHFNTPDGRNNITVSWDPDALAAYMRLGKYAIPIKMKASPLKIVSDKDFLLLVPVTE